MASWDPMVPPLPFSIICQLFVVFRSALFYGLACVNLVFFGPLPTQISYWIWFFVSFQNILRYFVQFIFWGKREKSGVKNWKKRNAFILDVSANLLRLCDIIRPEEATNFGDAVHLQGGLSREFLCMCIFFAVISPLPMRKWKKKRTNLDGIKFKNFTLVI